jgi:3-hydroxyisobutyrate dehydrogenase-like beta-hydroxyacid dehydrogenase
MDPSAPGERVGFAGLGIMGSRMAARLAAAGVPLTVWNRTTATAEAFAAAHGAQVASDPAELARASDVVITMVVDGAQVRSVLLDPQGVVAGAHPGLLCVDMSTIAPGETRAIGGELAAAGVGLVDAPVTGSAPRAENGTLTIMAGGTSQDVERARPLLDHMGSLVLHVGELGQGEMVKLINNAVAAANATALGEALLVARATGVDPAALIQVLGEGSGGSTMSRLKAGPMVDHDFTPLFKLEHMLKDVRLCLEEAQGAAVPFAAAAHARDILVAAMARGRADADFAAIIEPLEGLAGRQL